MNSGFPKLDLYCRCRESGISASQHLFQVSMFIEMGMRACFFTGFGLYSIDKHAAILVCGNLVDQKKQNLLEKRGVGYGLGISGKTARYQKKPFGSIHPIGCPRSLFFCEHPVSFDSEYHPIPHI